MRLMARSSRTAGAFWLRLYPKPWRARYGAEMLGLFESHPIDWRTRLDLARGAMDAHLHPLAPPSIPVIAAAVAGTAWIVAGAAGLIEPVPPDWPGYLVWTLPLGLVGSLAALVVVLAVGRRSGLRGGRVGDLAFGLALAGHLGWIAALVLAVVGGPYGALTAAAQSIAAVGTVAVGLVRWRADDHRVAEAVLIAGAVMLVPAPAAWLVVGTAWIAVGMLPSRVGSLRV